jgi:predicted small metal-binding protein
MTKVLQCGAIVPGCDFVAHGHTEGEVLVKAEEHLSSAHDMDHVSERLKSKIRAAIRDEAVQEPSGT